MVGVRGRLVVSVCANGGVGLRLVRAVGVNTTGCLDVTGAVKGGGCMGVNDGAEYKGWELGDGNGWWRL